MNDFQLLDYIWFVKIYEFKILLSADCFQATLREWYCIKKIDQMKQIVNGWISSDCEEWTDQK